MFRTSTSHKIFKGHLAVLLATAALAGCAAGPDFQPPAPPTEPVYLPQGAPSAGPSVASGVGQQLELGRTLKADWWKSLGSPELNEAVDAALAHNWSLAAVRANLAKAKQIVNAARGGLLPREDLEVDPCSRCPVLNKSRRAGRNAS